MSTDTAFALGLLALVGPRFPQRLRAFMLTIAVVDDIVALLVIAAVYSEDIELTALLVGIAAFGVCWSCGPPAFARDPVSRGVGTGDLGRGPRVGRRPDRRRPRLRALFTFAYTAARSELERATERFRAFREQPTPELARIAQRRGALHDLAERAAAAGLPPVDELSDRPDLRARERRCRDRQRDPRARRLISGDARDRRRLRRRQAGRHRRRLLARDPADRGCGRRSAGRPSSAAARSPASGSPSSLLVASLAFDGAQLADAKIGIIAAALIATLVTWLLFSATARLAPRLRAMLLLGTAEPLTDLYLDVDPERDHIRGPDDAPVTIVEYGDFQCPYCGQAEPVIRELLRDFGDVAYVWRHLPLNDVHLYAQLAAEAGEAAAEQGAFWPMHDLLLAHQDALTARISSATPSSSDSTSSGSGTTCARQRRRAGRRGRRQRRPQRRLGHADLLHQRPSPLRRLRHRHAVRRHPRGGRARDAAHPERAARKRRRLTTVAAAGASRYY